MRFVYGLSINHVSDRIHYQKNVIVDDSQSGLLQFANALSILALKEQEISLILVFFYRSLRVVSATRFLKERWWWLERLKEQAFHSDLDIKS